MAVLGSILDRRYQLVRLLGQGGMGAVYEAVNLRTRRRVAIKTLHPAFCAKEHIVARLWREAQAASQMRHPNIVDVLDLGVDDATGEHFIVQELLDGQSLEAILKDRLPQPLPPDDALEIIVPVMGALVACHRQGIIHRDIKPGNVFVTVAADGRTVAKLIDFGISKVDDASVRQTATGMILGTPAYMAPEQARGDTDVDARADVWSVGVMLYEALSGRLPYVGPNANVLIMKLLTSRPVPLAELGTGLSPQLVAAIDRAVEPDREKRFASMKEFVAALLECDLSPSVRATLVDTAPTSQAPPEPVVFQAPMLIAPRAVTDVSWGATIVDAKSRKRLSLGIAAVILTVLLVVGGLIAFGGSHDDSASHTASSVGVPPVTAVSTPNATNTPPVAPAANVPTATAPAVASPQGSPAGGARPTGSARTQLPVSGSSARTARSHRGRSGATIFDPLAPSDPYARRSSP